MAQKSPSQIINTFNHFFATIPGDKSFDMSYKAYIQDLADVEDRASLSSLSRRASSTGLASSVQQQPVTIASYGNIPYSSSSTNVMEKTPFLSTPSAQSSTTDISTKPSETNWSVTMSQVDRICADNMARKQRSMVNLVEFNKALGLPYYALPPAESPPETIYENLTKLSTRSPAPSTFTDKQYEFGKVIDSKSRPTTDVELFIKISDCFD